MPLSMRIKSGIPIVALAVLAAACMGDAESPAELRIVTPTPESQAMARPTPSPIDEPSPTPEPTPEPDPTPTPGNGDPPADGLDAAMASAARALSVRAGGDCVEGEDCIRELPDGGTRVDGPIARLAYVSAAGGGAVATVARDAAGAWQFWMLGGGEVYQLLDVPGQLRICSDASALAVRDAPDAGAAVTGELSHGEVVRARAFVLTEPGTLESPGAGWYQVEGAIDGWVPSRETSDAAHGDCSLRNHAEGEPGTVG